MSGIRPAGAVVVVTGAGSGIGAATARRYATLGATVVATDIDLAAAEATAKACRDAIGVDAAATAYRCDVAEADAVDELVATVAQRHGGTDVLVNNAGVGVGGPFLEASLDDWTWLRSINLDGLVHGCRAFGREMVRRGRGQVVNIASGAGYLPSRRMAGYCATKAAVIMLSRCLRAEWASSGVGVSVLCPGVINTPILGRTRLHGIDARERERMDRLFRISHSPDIVAKAVVQAASRNRGFVPVGVEVQLAYQVMRLLPNPVLDRVARI